MDAQPARDIVASNAGDLLQRTLYAVENTLQQAGAELDCQRVAQAVHGLTGAQSVGRFVSLHDCIVAFEGNDLADDVEAADAHLLAVAPTRQVDAQNRTVDLADVTTTRLCHCGPPTRAPAWISAGNSCCRIERWIAASRRLMRPSKRLSTWARLSEVRSLMPPLPQVAFSAR